jgi:hypothetical protein
MPRHKEWFTHTALTCLVNQSFNGKNRIVFDRDLVLVQRESYKSDLGISYTFDEFSEASGFFRKDFEERIG